MDGSGRTIASASNAEYIEVESIRALARMEPYVACWCKSGGKYKFCHYQRDRKSTINVFDIEAESRKQFASGYCSFPTRPGRICRWTKTRRFSAKFKASAGSSQNPISADCIINMSGSDLR
jgi:hypothetical protein